MDKFVYICDLHYGATPISRKDIYNDAILRKLTFVLEVCRKNKCILLIGGDLTDKPHISMSCLYKLFVLFNLYTDVKIIMNRGNFNHDGQPESSPMTLLDLAFENILISDTLYWIEYPYTKIVLAPNSKNPRDFEDHISDLKSNILMTHHIIVKNPTIYDHYLIDDFETEFDMVMIADYHPQQGIIEKDNTKFVSTGALARKKGTTSSRERIPSFAYIKVNKDGFNVVLKEIPYEKDVFIEDIKDEKEPDMIIEQVRAMSALIDLDLNQMDTKTAIKTFSDKVGIDGNITDYVIDRLENQI